MSGHWITLRGGAAFDLLEPNTEVLDIEAIAHSLGMLCRFTGHVDRFYSVAQHSVLVSYLTPDEHALAGLLHDATEAFVGDVATPLKSLLPGYKAIEDAIEAALSARFGHDPSHPAVKEADLRALYIERDHYMGEQPAPWEHEHLSIEMKQDGYPCRDIVRLSWDPATARTIFLTRFDELTSKGV